MARHDFTADRPAPGKPRGLETRASARAFRALAREMRDAVGPVDTLSPKVRPECLAWLDAIRRANGLDTWGEAAALVLCDFLLDPGGVDPLPRDLADLLPPRHRVFGRARIASALSSRVSMRLPGAAVDVLRRVARRKNLGMTAAASALIELVRRDDLAEEAGQ